MISCGLSLIFPFLLATLAEHFFVPKFPQEVREAAFLTRAWVAFLLVGDKKVGEGDFQALLWTSGSRGHGSVMRGGGCGTSSWRPRCCLHGLGGGRMQVPRFRAGAFLPLSVMTSETSHFSDGAAHVKGGEALPEEALCSCCPLLILWLRPLNVWHKAASPLQELHPRTRNLWRNSV